MCWWWGGKGSREEAIAGRGESLLHLGTRGSGVTVGAKADMKGQVG